MVGVDLEEVAHNGQTFGTGRIADGVAINGDRHQSLGRKDVLDFGEVGIFKLEWNPYFCVRVCNWKWCNKKCCPALLTIWLDDGEVRSNQELESVEVSVRLDLDSYCGRGWIAEKIKPL